MGLSQERHFQNYHRVLNRVKWSSLAASKRLLLSLLDAFVPDGPLLMALDDTIERRRGAKIAAKGIYRDPVRSSHNHFVKASGLRWLCLMLLAPIPWAGLCWALPFCSVLAPSQRYYLDRQRRPNKLTDRARQLLLMVKRWLPERALVVVADSSFAALELLGAVRQVFISPLAQRFGIAMASRSCRYAGCWCATRKVNSNPRRFCVPITFEEARAHLGMETQRQ